MAEDAWNSRDPDRVVSVYNDDTRWRNRVEFPMGRDQVLLFLQRKSGFTGQGLTAPPFCQHQ